MDKFKLETQWQLYLQRVGLDESKMPAIQVQETKRAFMGACGQMLLLLRDDVSELPEEQAIAKLDEMLSECGEFWNNETVNLK